MKYPLQFKNKFVCIFFYWGGGVVGYRIDDILGRVYVELKATACITATNTAQWESLMSIKFGELVLS